MEWCPPLHVGVVVIKNGAFESPSTKVANFTYFILYQANIVKHDIYKKL